MKGSNEKKKWNEEEEEEVRFSGEREKEEFLFVPLHSKEKKSLVNERKRNE